MRAKKKFGQHFLKDPNLLRKIVDTAGIEPGDLVWEIGPGKGTLTRELLSRECRLTVFEIDSDLYPILEEDFKNRIRLIKKDILKCNWQDHLKDTPLKLVSNLPFQITSPLLLKITDHWQNFSKIVLMIQKEVAGRLKAEAGSSDYSFLTVRIGFFFQIKYEFTVKRHLFQPIPRVDSAVISLVPRKNIEEITDEALFWKIVNSAFARRRKTLRNNLRTFLSSDKMLRLESITPVNLNRRGETLTRQEFVELYRIIESTAG